MGVLRDLFNRTRVPVGLRTQLQSEGLIYLAEKVGVSLRFSGAIPGLFSAASVNRGSGMLAITRQRLYATFASAPWLDGPTVDQRWDATQEGPARVTISDAGVALVLDIRRVDPRFSGELSLRYRRPLTDDVLAQLPARSLAFIVAPDFVFHLLGVRAKT